MSEACSKEGGRLISEGNLKLHCQKVKDTKSGGFDCLCNCHDDHNPSFHWEIKKVGWVGHCKTCGAKGADFAKKAGIKVSELFADAIDTNRASPGEQYVRKKYNRHTLYDYFSFVDGSYDHTKIRYYPEWANGDKKFANGYWGNDGRFNDYKGCLKDRKPQTAIFGNVALIKQCIAEKKIVYYCEGEKDVQTMQRLGYPAFTQGGCTAFNKELAPLLKDIRLIILEDNDPQGQSGANKLRNDLLPYAETIKVITPCTDFVKADITDFFNNHDKSDFEKLIAENTAVTDTNVCSHATVKNSSAPKGAPLVRKLMELDAANKFPLTDIGSATLFSAVFKNKHRYSVTAKDWFFYDGQRWILDREGLRARKSAKELSKALSIYAVNCLPDEDEKRKEQYLKYALTWTYSRTRNAIIQDSRDLNFISNEELDADDYVLNLQNCVLVFHEDKVEKHEHSADLLLSKIANAEYRPEARCERWEQFLDEVMQGDKDKIHYLQKLFGTCLTGDVRLEKMWFLFGSTTRNGKSTMIERIADVLGDYSKTIRPETLAIKNNPDSRTASPDVAKLAGTRLCVCSEIPKRMPLDVGLLKTLTGRDTIVARFLHQDEFQFVPKFKMICNTNFLPVVSDNTIFKSDRVQVVSFDRHFEESEQDKTLKDKLSTKEALSGILNWMIEGWIAFCREGLEVPEAIKKSTTDYEASSDKLQNFINECLAEAEGKNISVKETYARYEKWCSENGYHVENKQNFISDCKAKGIYKERGMVDGSQVRNIIKDYEFAEDGFMEIDGDIPFK